MEGRGGDGIGSKDRQYDHRDNWWRPERDKGVKNNNNKGNEDKDEDDEERVDKDISKGEGRSDELWLRPKMISPTRTQPVVAALIRPRRLHRETLDDEDSTKFEHARRLVWGLVFQGWDTGKTPRKPPRNAPLRSMVHVKVLIGCLIHDTPTSAQIASAVSPATDSSAVKENNYGLPQDPENLWTSDYSMILGKGSHFEFIL
ncbi:hypothetical protein CKAH01_14606 [Colletotrichum kahawae]|uniref:Uncharacterized protein n=1 Tax=Colletotrichum kahawae TaxID=34407 RepID=A0AAE0D9Z7_COLKA|nr:hypothetical protein CKAH01_14606 [Colletotrichum kahawae]